MIACNQHYISLEAESCAITKGSKTIERTKNVVICNLHHCLGKPGEVIRAERESAAFLGMVIDVQKQSS